MPFSFTDKRMNGVLAKDGAVIKVVPGKSYLHKLKEILYENTSRQSYENNGTVKCFWDNLNVTRSQDIQYDVILDKGMIADLVSMTPLAWGMTEGRIARLLAMDSLKLTVDLKILWGKDV